MKRPLHLFPAFAALLFLVLTGCPRSGGDPASDASSQEPALEGTRWVLDSLPGFNGDIPLNPQPPHLLIDADSARASGFSGCNNFTGGYTTAPEGALQFSQMASTRKYCEDRMEMEAQFLAAILAVRSYTITESGLSLSDADGTTLLVFKTD